VSTKERGLVKIYGRKAGVVLLVVLLLGIFWTGVTLAAEFGGGEIYRLSADAVVDDDLYVAASEAYIDGVVNGDLYASGGYIEINGEVTGDVVMAGAGIVISGLVGDDVRVAGAGIDIIGSIQDDLFVAGGGAGPGGFVFPFQIGSQSIRQGVRVASSSEIGGDGYIVGGEGQIEGSFGGALFAGMGTLLMGARVNGDAELRAQTLTIDEDALVTGQLIYSTPDRLANMDEVAANVVYEPVATEEESPNIIAEVFGWVLRTALILVGFALLGWLSLRFVPNTLIHSADTIDAEPVETGLYGLVGTVLFIFIPILSGVMVLLTWLFWGIFPAIVMFIFLFGTLSLLWLFSPLVTGLWLGRRIISQTESPTSLLITLMIGVLIIVVLGRVPFLGWLVYLVSFVFALGGLIRMGRTQRSGPSGTRNVATVTP
jgi:hypothetical protein